MPQENNILKFIGNTPIVEIKNLNPNKKVRIFAKLEGFNPTGSIKDRIALAMVEKAEKQGVLKQGKTIIEPTSGNTGIALAMVANIKGYKLKIVMSEAMSIERRKILSAFGAEIILVKPEDWRDAAIKITKKMAENDENLVLLNQFENEVNFETHYEITGREILEQIGEEKIDYFVAGLGTGGTITGIAKRLKEKFPKMKTIGVQPKLGSKIEGLKSLKDGYVPPIMDLGAIDEIIEIDENNIFKTINEIAQKEGIFSGPSSAAAMIAVQQISKKIDSGNILTIFPDRGEKYISTL
ncbi:MAG: cysteine synthase family protein [bacterium]|nr:cysteine synthase family protein [bacterium]